MGERKPRLCETRVKEEPIKKHRIPRKLPPLDEHEGAGESTAKRKSKSKLGSKVKTQNQVICLFIYLPFFLNQHNRQFTTGFFEKRQTVTRIKEWSNWRCSSYSFTCQARRRRKASKVISKWGIQ